MSQSILVDHVEGDLYDSWERGKGVRVRHSEVICRAQEKAATLV